MSWGGILTPGGHTSPTVTEVGHRSRWGEGRSWPRLPGSLLCSSLPGVAGDGAGVLSRLPDPVMWAEGGDNGSAEAFGPRLLVSRENSDKNFSQVV